MKLRGTARRFRALRASELGGLAGDSLYTAVWLGAVSVADLVQVALVAHILGLDELGKLALVMSTVVLIGQFFDVRVGTAETTFGAARIASRDWDGAASVFRFGYGIDAVTGVVGFVIVACVAPIVGPSLIGSGGTELMLLYGLTLLASTIDESSATVLRLMGRFRLLAVYMTGLEATRIAAVGIALAVDQSLAAVLVALVAYDIAGAAANWLVANHVFSQASGRSLVARTPGPFAEKRAMLRMIIHTNLVSYARIAQVQLPILLLGGLTSSAQVGLYKVGTAAGSMVGRIAAPVYAAVLPRLSRLWAAQRRDEIARLIREATPLAAAVVGVAFFLLLLFRTPILRLIGGDEATDAVPVLVLVGIGYAVSGVLFWYPGLVFAMGRAGAVSVISLSTAVLQVALLVPLTIAWEATGAALALCASMVVSNLVGAGLGLRVLHSARSGPSQDDRNAAGRTMTATSSGYGRLP